MAQLMTVGEVADYLRTTKTTVYRWLKEGKLTAVRVGKEWRIDEENLHSSLQPPKGAAETSAAFWASLHRNEHLLVITNKSADVAGFEIDFFKKALEEGARLLKGCWWQNEEELLAQYEAGGLDTESLQKKGTLTVVDFNRLYRRDGIEGPIEAWRSNIEKSVADGCGRLWASGSPNMNCCGDSSRLLTFETRLDETIRTMPVVGACPYSLEDEANRENFGKIMSLMAHHSGVAFYNSGQYALLRA